MKPIREKRHRLPHAAYSGDVVAAFTIDAKDRKPYFKSTGIIDIAHQAMAEAFVQHHGHAAVYLFMPDHMHLIVSGKSSDCNLLDLVEKFKQKTTYRVRQTRTDFTWQKDYYDHIIRASEDYGAQVRYLLRNPVAKGMCEHWEHWPYKGVLGQTWEQLAVNIATI